ncbi:hypothetical protein [Devosia sp.]|uniref:hypothetical protein n=1 Tax=Devosia sp. TaxID=1871048 RepID=UPI0032663493
MTQQPDFKQRFVAILGDLQRNGANDPEAMQLLGAMATNVSNSLGNQAWSQTKANMGEAQYRGMLQAFETEGVEHLKAGREKHAYALQALTVSLIASRQPTDPELRAGEGLLDALINAAMAVRLQKPAKLN